jgi:hypothetical protein
MPGLSSIEVPAGQLPSLSTSGQKKTNVNNREMGPKNEDIRDWNDYPPMTPMVADDRELKNL